MVQDARGIAVAPSIGGTTAVSSLEEETTPYRLIVERPRDRCLIGVAWRPSHNDTQPGGETTTGGMIKPLLPSQPPRLRKRRRLMTLRFCRHTTTTIAAAAAAPPFFLPPRFRIRPAAPAFPLRGKLPCPSSFCRGVPRIPMVVMMSPPVLYRPSRFFLRKTAVTRVQATLINDFVHAYVGSLPRQRRRRR